MWAAGPASIPPLARGPPLFTHTGQNLFAHWQAAPQLLLHCLTGYGPLRVLGACSLPTGLRSPQCAVCIPSCPLLPPEGLGLAAGAAGAGDCGCGGSRAGGGCWSATSSSTSFASAAAAPTGVHLRGRVFHRPPALPTRCALRHRGHRP